jgi:galactokinase
VPAYRAPGRVNLIGEHTDYAGGLVLPIAIDRAVTLRCRPAARVRLRASEPPGTIDLPADGGGAAEGYGRYVAALAAELAELGRAPAGIDGVVESDLPVGAGLSSSAALLVAAGLALCDAAGLELEPLELAAACRRAEARAVGVPCGIMDPAVSLLGEAGAALLLDCGTLDHRLVPLPPGLGVIVVDSGVRRSLAETGYAARRAELERALAGDLDEVTARRLRHLRSENARVEQAVAALAAADAGALGPILAAGHASLRDDFQVSTPELDLLVELALGAGALGARMTGGGFGGSIVALAPREECAAVAEAIAAGYRARTGRETAPIVTRAADGASVTSSRASGWHRQ